MASKRAGELIAKQFGPIARRQLLAVGFTRWRVESWRGTGRLHDTRFPGVYAGGRAELSETGDLSAALLFAGHGSALTDIGCLWWRGYLHRRPDHIHVDSPTRCRSYADLRVRHPRKVGRVWHRGLPVVPLPVALLAATEQLTRDSIRLVLGRIEFDRKLQLQELEAALGPGVTGSRKLRMAMDSHLPQLAKCANGREREFVLLCEARELPIPEPNEQIGRFRPDMLWESHRLIVELDGPGAHSTPAQIARDEARQGWLESQGYTVIRFTHDDVRFRPDWVVSEVRAALAATV